MVLIQNKSIKEAVTFGNQLGINQHYKLKDQQAKILQNLSIRRNMALNKQTQKDISNN